MMAKFWEGDRNHVRPLEIEEGVSHRALGRDHRWEDECQRASVRGRWQASHTQLDAVSATQRAETAAVSVRKGAATQRN
jgi:hypothetical protein